MKTAVFWVAPCSLIEVYRRFRGPSTRLYGATQKTVIIEIHKFRLEVGLFHFLQLKFSDKLHCDCHVPVLTTVS
jgi:hypothetical protein